MNSDQMELMFPGTSTEIRLSRALAREIEQVTNQYGNVVPNNVMQAYYKLCDHYKFQMENEYS